MIGKPIAWLGIALLLAAASGAACPQMLQQYTQAIPRALPAGATLTQVVDVVNNNGNQIVSLYTNHGSVSVPGLPSLRALVAFQRQRNLRLRADTAFTGPEVDVGSNDQMFWFWIRRNQPPGLFFCRHDQFAQSAARPIVPIEPEWLIRALGVITFEPGLVHQGPIPISAGRLEIRTLPTVTGGNTRVTVIDATRGIVLEEHVYDPQGTRLATALMSRHRRDPTTGITLPRHVTLQLPPTHAEINLDLNDLQINQLNPSQTDLWTKPVYPGYQDVDLADPNLRLTVPGTVAAPPPNAQPAYVPPSSAPLSSAPPVYAPPAAQPAYAPPAYTPPANVPPVYTQPTYTPPANAPPAYLPPTGAPPPR